MALNAGAAASVSRTSGIIFLDFCTLNNYNNKGGKNIKTKRR
jgi:hypothetical protein